MGRVPLVAFDFDGTLTTGDTVAGFARRIVDIERRPALMRGVRSVPALAAAVANRDRDRVRAAATRIVFSGVPHDVVTTTAMDHADDIVAHRLRGPTVGLLRAHQRAGAISVVVSASYEEYLLPVAARLGVDAVIGTRLEVRDGICTGELIDGNCRGPEKVRRLAVWMAEQGIERDNTQVWAYGDSNGDRELLAWSDHPRWVGPRANIL